MAGTPTQQGTFTFTVTESAQAGPPLQQTYSIAVGPPLPLTDTTENSPPAAGTVGTAYGAGFTVSGGEAPYTWTVATGQVPPGLAFSSPNLYEMHAHPGADIILSGTPTKAGTFNFTMKVTDSLGDTATQSLSITIKA